MLPDHTTSIADIFCVLGFLFAMYMLVKFFETWAEKDREKPNNH